MKDARGNYAVMKYDVKGNLLEEIKLRAGALAPAAAYIPVVADVASWAINTYDTVTTPTGNLLTSKKVRDFATLAGPTVTFTYDASELFPIQISRLGDKNGDGLINASDPADVKTLAQDRKRVTRPRSLTTKESVEIRYAEAAENQFRGSSRPVVSPAYRATTRQDLGH